MNGFRNKTILVTGGAGAIGGNVVFGLLSHGATRVIVLDDLSSGYAENVPQGAEFVRGSVCDDTILERVFSSDVDMVFHLAAHFANQNSVEHPEADLNTNGLGTLKLLEYSLKFGVQKFLYASSSCVYGNVPKPITEDSPIQCDTPYAITKHLGEQYVQFFYEFHDLNTVIVRYFNSFGPGERPGKYRNVIPNFIATALRGDPLVVTGDGNETRDFNFIENTVSGTLLAADSTESNGKIYNIGSGLTTRVRDIAEMINRLTGNSGGIEFVPRRSWDHVLTRVANISKARKELGYAPVVDLEAQLRKTIEWIKLHI